MIDATTSFVPKLVEISIAGLTTVYDAMHNVFVFGVPLDAVVAAIIFMNCVAALYIWRFR